MQINFDLDEFIAYLLNGSLVLIALNASVAIDLFKVVSAVVPGDNVARGALQLTVYGALALIAGHVSSIFSRYLTRRLLWVIKQRPRDRPFNNEANAFWTDELNTMIRRKYDELFAPNVPTSPDNISKIGDTYSAAPRLIRAYVLDNSQAARSVRERIVRARSICANSVLPLLMMTSLGWTNGSIGWAILSLGSAVLMLLKQYDLDEREWKEIYLTFLSKP